MAERTYGILFKQGYSLPPHWRPRYFILEGRSLLYYMGEAHARMQGSTAKLHVFFEHGFQVAGEGEANEKSLFVLSITDPSSGRVVHLGASTQHERDQWLVALRRTTELACGGAQEALSQLSAVQLDHQIEQIVQHVQQLVEQDRWLLAHAQVQRLEASLDAAPSRQAARLRERIAPHHDLFVKVRTQATWAEESLALFERNDGWTVVQDRGGTQVSFKQEEGKPYGSLKIDAVIDSELVKMAALVAEADLLPLWLPFCNRGNMIVKPSHMHGFVHLMFDMPLLIPLSNRDAVLEGRGVDVMERNMVLIMLRSIDGDPPPQNPHCTIPPPEHGYTRVEATGGFLFSPLSANSVRMKLILNVDLKAPMLRPAVVNQVNKVFGGLMVSLIKKALRTFDQSEYAERIQCNRDFYGNLEARIKEVVEKQYGGGSPARGSDSDSGASRAGTAGSLPPHAGNLGFRSAANVAVLAAAVLFGAYHGLGGPGGTGSSSSLGSALRLRLQSIELPLLLWLAFICGLLLGRCMR